jgi:Skp family chaperone for outer membrane proteins
MNPKTLKSVYKQINKEELKSEKIELALVDDLNNDIKLIDNSIGYVNLDSSIQDAKQFLKIRDDYSRKAEQFFNENDTLDNFYKKLEKDLNKLEQSIDNYERSARDLGINPKAYASYNMATQLYDEGQRELQKFLSNRNMILDALNTASKAN